MISGFCRPPVLVVVQVNQLPAVPGRHQGGLSAAEREGQKEGGGCLAVFKFSHSGDNQVSFGARTGGAVVCDRA